MESMEATGNERKFFFLWCVFLLFKGLRRMFSFLLFLLGDRQGEEETSVDGSGNVW